MIGGAVASIFFPAPCRACGGILDSGDRIPLCTACLAAIVPIAGPQCQRCGKPIISLVAAQTTQVLLCHMCRRELYDFDFARSFAKYDGALVHAVLALKYDEVRPLGGWFAKRLATIVRANPENFVADAVVPCALRHAVAHPCLAQQVAACQQVDSAQSGEAAGEKLGRRLGPGRAR